MALLDLTPEQRHTAEVTLRPIFDQGYHPERIDFYLRLCVEAGVRGDDTILELVAAMIGESGLDNRKFGDSDMMNPNFGVGWMQLDTGYHVKDLSSLIAFRADPLASLHYVLATPDLCKRGKLRDHFNEQRWHAWEAEVIDPTEGWSPLEAVTKRMEALS